MDSFINIVASYIVYILVGVTISLNIFKNDDDRIKAMQLFFISLSVFSVYVAIIYWGYLTRGSRFISLDEQHFFGIAQSLGEKPSISSIYKVCFKYRIHIENEGAHFYRGFLAYIANNYLCGNSPLIQYMNSAFVASLCSIYLYKIIKQYIPTKESFKYVLVYVVCSYLILSGGKITRDVQINFLYIWGLSILFSSFSIRKLILLVGIVLITIQFRLEHGLFMAFMPVLYIYEKSKERENFKYVRKFLIVLILIVGIFVASVVIVYIQAIMSTMEGYVEFTSGLTEQGGLAKYLLRLPVGIKQLVIVIYSQISPFPSWNQLLDSNNIFESIDGFIEMISPFFWFIVCFGTVKYIWVKEYRKNIPTMLLYTGIVFIIFLFANTSNMNPRRLVCMYPVLYLIFSYGYYNYPTFFKNNVIISIFAYLGLCVLYLFIKY
ncbi:hypothetical protein ACT3CE_05935 [Marinifilum sp. RC60d5]|uniref:hypothetical protein n=1 Tax=Marinifilum sp. RC60d5 TaxID=3458414 RepID=UPI0040357E30